MKMFSEEIVCLIEEFTGPSYWKHHFSSKVLPRLNKGWKLVGSTQPYMEYQGGEPCSNCYVWGNGRDVGCGNHESICDNSLMIWTYKEQIFDEQYWHDLFSCRIVPHLNICRRYI